MSKNFISNVSIQYEYFDIQLRYPDWANKKVLDFGGNIGNILTDPDCKIKEENYWCIDVSKDAIETGKVLYPKAHFEFYDCYNLSFNPNGIPGLPIPDLGERFDIIIAYSIFTHIGRDETVNKIDQLRQLLAKDGILVFTFLVSDYNASQHFSGFQDITNLEKRIRRLNDGQLNHSLLEKSKGADYMALVNGKQLYTNVGSVQDLPQQKGDTLFTYFTPAYLQTLYDCEIVPPPRSPYHEFYPAEMQHTCIIKNQN